MVLTEDELEQVYELVKRADLEQLVGLNSLVNGVMQQGVKDAQEKLVLLLDFYEKSKIRGK